LSLCSALHEAVNMTQLCGFPPNVLAAVAMFLITALYLTFWQVTDLDLPHVMRRVSFSKDTDAYTIVIATFRRDSCLKLSILHYLTCNPQELRVKWQDFKRPLPRWLRQVQGKYSERLVIDVADGDYLSSRFKLSDLKTSAIFPVDDDVRHSCAYMREAFRMWQRRPRKVFGFAPRHVQKGGCYRYWGSYAHLYYPFSNTVWVTKGAFLHRDYLKEYFSQKYDSLRKLVDGNTTGEDMLMTFVVALSNPPGERWPVVLYSRSWPGDKTCSNRALSKTPVHTMRCPMLRHFQEVLGFPLELSPWSEFYLFEDDVETFVPFSQSGSGHWAMPWYPLRMYWRVRVFSAV